MGYELMQAASVVGCHLPARPFKVLLRMAWTALDRDQGDSPACLYYKGWEPLALAIGYGDVETAPPARRKKAKNSVVAAIATLVSEGFLEPVGGRAGFGSRQTYRLSLLGPPKEGSNRTPEEGAQQTPEKGVQQDPRNGNRRTPEMGVPRNKEDQPKESDQDQPLTAVVTLPVATGCALCGGRTTSEGDCVNPRCAHPSTGEGAPLRRAR